MTGPYEPSEDERRVIAWLRKCYAGRLAHHRAVCMREDDDVLDAIITAANAFRDAAEMIEQGHHRHDRD